MASKALLLVPLLFCQVCILVSLYTGIFLTMYPCTQVPESKSTLSFLAGGQPGGRSCNRARLGERSDTENSSRPRFSLRGGRPLCRTPCGSPPMETSQSGQILARGSGLYSAGTCLPPGCDFHFSFCFIMILNNNKCDATSESRLSRRTTLATTPTT